MRFSLDQMGHWWIQTWSMELAVGPVEGPDLERGARAFCDEVWDEVKRRFSIDLRGRAVP